jgi:hypothetical protein
MIEHVMLPATIFACKQEGWLPLTALQQELSHGKSSASTLL